MLDARCDHFLDGLVGDIDGALDLDDFFDAGFHVAGEDVEDAVGVDLELDADAGLAFGRGFEGEIEAAEFPIVARHLALALEHADEHRLLAGHGVGEHLAGLRGNGGVARNDDVHQPAEGLDAEGERRDIEQHDVADRAGEDARLDGRAERDGFVGVLRDVRLALEYLGDELADERHAGLAAHEDDGIEIGRASAAHRPASAGNARGCARRWAGRCRSSSRAASE